VGGEARDLIIGGDSMIGQAMQMAWPGAAHTSRRTEAEWHVDLAEDPEQWRLPSRIGRAIFCAGLTDIQQCAANPERSWQINVKQTIELAKRLADRGGRVIFLSTSHVFRQTDIPPNCHDERDPQTLYGRHKAETEDSITKLGEIIRLTKVIPNHFSLFENWVNLAKHRLPIKAFNDYDFAPVSIAQVTDRLRQATGEAGKIQHLSAAFAMTYAEAAGNLFDRLGLSSELIQSTSAKHLIDPASLNACTCLASDNKIRPEAAIEAFVAARAST
jgi:dTDP-4-dehydrorhamnose reductase